MIDAARGNSDVSVQAWLRGKPSPGASHDDADIFAAVARGRLVEHPYPHLVVENAIPRELADTLLATMRALRAGRARHHFNAVNEAPRERFRFVHTYPYRHNLLILPLSTPAALHGVSPCGRTDKPRYHLHLVGELTAPLFAIPHSADRDTTHDACCFS